MNPANLADALERYPRGWRVRLSLTAEQVSVEKQTFVVEEVEIRREMVEDVEPITKTVRREELRVEARGDLETSQSPAQERTYP